MFDVVMRGCCSAWCGSEPARPMVEAGPESMDAYLPQQIFEPWSGVMLVTPETGVWVISREPVL